ncbi:MAG: hypothetical protein A2X55_07815 [Nitrospirae bacterium GWB2_47_37]|nr:MAG: hypothetical protein A2X55_07815 [Nitrospirae bacterium GWB2_47_37]
MPVISVYLKKNDYERIKARSIAEEVPLSRLVRVSIEKHILTEDQKSAREELIQFLKKSLTGSWEDVHKEREKADACRR